MKFKDFKIDDKYVEVLEKNYITTPTKIQEEAIPHILGRRDVIGKAQTGTGKTLAFLLPVFNLIDKENKHTQVLVIVPTRELADQITEVCKILSEPFDIGVVSVFGGHNIESQISRLRNKVQIVVGTPGRILDHLRRGTINFKFLKHMIIDEADQMLAYGFMEDLELLSSKIPENIQIMMFSATMPENIQHLARKIMRNPITIEIDPEIVVLDQIKQLVIKTTEDRRLDSLIMALDIYNPFMAIIFTKSKQRAKELYHAMLEKGITDVEVLHGELSQNKREQILKKFRSLKLPYLIATDIAARGMDIEGVTHVFNYDTPRDTEYYIHRVGRTGRQSEDGVAVTLVDENDEKYLSKIEKIIKLNIPKVYDRSDYERAKLNFDDIRNMRVEQVRERKFKKTNSFTKSKSFGKSKSFTKPDSRRKKKTKR
ncbi:DEAD/DEAH box helicase [Proteocatella sphenisci]|uniref:DEAD/DEAH box helicase n=1 Tax=Proteocatella sphenisci TaxID=181070 RepID=UPI0004ACAB09|nr:DEAD/DEAH box helicase [Proteocatella sphenisci]